VGVTGTRGVTAAVGLVMPSTRPNIWAGLPALRAAAAAIGTRLRARDDDERMTRTSG
jgi:hypothetical protein